MFPVVVSFPKQRNEQDLQTMQLTQEKFVIDYQTKEQLRGQSPFEYKDKIKNYRPGLVLDSISPTLHCLHWHSNYCEGNFIHKFFLFHFSNFHELTALN